HELRTYLKTGQEEGVIENEEQQMIYNVFDFGDSMVKDVMVPRIDMQMVSIDANYKDLIALVREEGYTRFPVYDGSIDSIVGTINIKDLFSLDPNKDFSLKDILRTPFFTYEYKKTAPLLMEMKNQSISLAIVLDEYGATAGLVTLEDLLEEIVGEIKDEYDQAEPDEIMPLIANKVYRVFGSTKLDDVNESLGLQLFSKEYDSVGGFIIEQLDFLPSPGQILTIEGQVELKVLKVYRKRIETVKITLLQGKNPESEDIENPPS
ncbi:MAG TPA: hemolysin family protein, partial [Lachnospiraceae bacterium]